jgi:DNA-binding response OmpR family regulator
MVKILVIDDDAAMREMVRRALADAHHEVIEAADGIEGINSFRAEAPAIVITDIVMPEQEGIQTIREMRAIRSDCVIIAMSGAGPGELYLNIAKMSGADAVLAKPFRPAELVALVDKLAIGAAPA